MYKFLYGPMLLFLMDKYPAVEWLSHVISVCSTSFVVMVYVIHLVKCLLKSVPSLLLLSVFL